MLSPSRGFCCCLPVKFGALVTSLLIFVGSGILAGVTLGTLANVSSHITLILTAGFYFTSLSWATLCLFSLLGLISVATQHPLILTIFKRFLLYHLPAGLLCNLFFASVLFHSYRNSSAITRSSMCTQPATRKSACDAFASLERLTWVYLTILVPAFILQFYVYVVIKRFIFVVSGQWDLQHEGTVEQQQDDVDQLSRQPKSPVIRNRTIRERRRAQAELWFTMDPNEPDAGDSFLPDIPAKNIIASPRTPFNRSASLLSPKNAPRLGKKPSKISLHSGSTDTTKKEKEELNLDKPEIEASNPGPALPPGLQKVSESSEPR